MWNRACPLCSSRVPRSRVLTRGEDLVCPSCHTPLELSRVSRTLGVSGGLLAGFAAVRVIADSPVPGGWAVAVVAAALAYGIASAMVLFFFADLVVQPNPPARHFPQAQN